jgi:hypothetical protein
LEKVGQFNARRHRARVDGDNFPSSLISDH